ncbi:MAG: hypothetical protein J6O56_00070 [Bacilli bacterium]|nr:hypothetical protein [Bacilli bacterium]
MKKKLFKVLFICIVIFSLSLNVLLLYEKININSEINEEKEKQKEIDDTIGKDDKGKKIEYDKETMGKLFKDYQVSSSLANSDNTVIFDVTKITYVGYFKSNEDRKLYYIDEKFSCMEGNDCVNVVGKVTLDNENNNNTTFVVAVTPVDKENALFEILDYSIEENDDFQKVKHIELK